MVRIRAMYVNCDSITELKAMTTFTMRAILIAKTVALSIMSSYFIEVVYLTVCK